MKSVRLEWVEEAFRKWRVERSSRTEAIPENLWSMAVGLYPEHNRSKICNRLRLSGHQFRRRLEVGHPLFAEPGFVLASREEVKLNLKSSAEVQLTIQGKERALSLCVGVDVLGQILPQLGALL